MCLSAAFTSICEFNATYKIFRRNICHMGQISVILTKKAKTKTTTRNQVLAGKRHTHIHTHTTTLLRAWQVVLQWLEAS